MKIAGKALSGPNIKYLAFPRQDGDIVFKLVAVLDYKEFDQLCPTPQAPEIIKPGGERYRDPTHPTYLKKMEEIQSLKTSWLFIQTLKDTPDLEWESVKYNDPSTWSKYGDELSGSGLSPVEVGVLLRGVIEVNGLDEAKIEEATARFLAGLAKQ